MLGGRVPFMAYVCLFIHNTFENDSRSVYEKKKLFRMAKLLSYYQFYVFVFKKTIMYYSSIFSCCIYNCDTYNALEVYCSIY